MGVPQPLRHLAHEGARHTGIHGFSGGGCRPDPMPSHYSTQGRRHFCLSLPEYRRLLAITRAELVGGPLVADAVGRLGGGYGDVDVFIDRCPHGCTDPGDDNVAVIGGFVYRGGRLVDGLRYTVDHDLAVYKAALRVMPTVAGFGMITGTA